MILDKNKVEEAVQIFLRNTKNEITTKSSCFKSGVSYAESQLSELAIEFTDYVSKYQYEQDSTTKLWKYWDNGIVEYTTKGLFEEFLKQRSK